MDAAIPELRYVELVEQDGLVRHSFDGLVKHLEEQLDPNIRDNILFFYLSGSRLYGTATEHSDWDYVCVTKGETKEARKSQACARNGDESISAAKPLMITDSNVYDMDATLEFYGLPTDIVPVGLRFDVCLITLAVWKRLAYEHSLIALEAQYLPPAFILYKDKHFPTFKIDPPILKTTASLLGGLKFANARPRMKEGNAAKAKRLGALGIRYLQFGIQLLESMRDTGEANITDWHSIKPIWEGIFAEHTPDNYDDYEAVFRPTFKGYDTHIRQIMVYPTLYTARERFLNSWPVLKVTLLKLDKIPKRASEQLDTPDWLSADSKTLLEAISADPANMLASEAIAKHHLFPTLSKCGSLLSFSASCTANFYVDVPANELHGMIITLPEWKVISPQFFSNARDVISLRSLASQEGETTAELGHLNEELIGLLEDPELEIREHFDGFRVAVYFHGEWRVSCIGGTVDGGERIATRTTEGRGPNKTTLAEQFTKVFAQFTSFGGKVLSQSLDALPKGSLHVFNLQTDCARAVTANPEPDRIVYQCSFPFDSSAPATAISIDPSWKIASSIQLEPFQSEVRQKAGWKAKLNALIEAVEFMNPFEQAGFELRNRRGQTAKICARSYWSVRASVGHHNRVLAFNIAADHFEPESLLDTCIYGFRREFAETFPKWAVPVDAAELELKTLCRFLDDYKAKYFTETDRKVFATTVSKLPAPMRAVCFEWYAYPTVSAHDVLASSELITLRQIKERLAEELKEQKTESK